MHLFKRLFRVGALFLLIVFPFMQLPIDVGDTARPHVQYMVDENYPPYTFSEQEYLYGFDPDLVNMIFKLEDYDVSFTTSNWENVYRSVKDGSVDIAGIIAVTEERKKDVLYSDSILTSHVAIYTLAHADEIKAEDLHTLRVAVGKGYYTEELLKSQLGIFNYHPYENMKLAFQDLIDGKIDVIFENQQFIEHLLVQESLRGKIVPQVTNLYPRSHAFAISKSRQDLVDYINLRVKVLKRTGVYEELYRKYFYSPSEWYAQQQRNRLIFIGIGFVCIITIIFIGLQLIIKKLKKNINAKYYELNEAHEELTAANEELEAHYEEIQSYSDKVNQLAFFDTLTGLPNRTYLNEKIANLFPIDEKFSAKTIAAFYVEMDNFRQINDTLGHEFGDQVLKAVACTLTENLDGQPLIARIGGDEFFILYDNFLDKSQIECYADRIVHFINKSWEIGEHEIYLSASIGVLMITSSCASVTDVYKKIDTAMYAAKKNNRGSYVFFNENMLKSVEYKSELEKSLRKGIDNKEFELYYQPYFDVEGEKILGVEALIRWHHPKKGFVSPGEFIPLAEETGLIIVIGEWVLEEAIKQSKSWQSNHGVSLPISINVAGIQLESESFVTFVFELLSKHDFEPNLLQLEITESSVMKNIKRNIRQLEALKAKGIKISLDDFGTGYSSLAYMMKLPIDIIKIDKSFVDDILTSNDDEIIVGDIISIAHRLNMHIIAEGVEQFEQLDYLKNTNCDAIQGYYFSKPLRNEDLEKLLS